MAEREPISVAVVEDCPRQRQDLIERLSEADDLVCVGAFADVESAVRTIPGLAPDVVVMDLRLADGSGIDATRRLLAGNPDLLVLAYTVLDGVDSVVEAILAGAVGYVWKGDSAQRLQDVIRLVKSGGSAISPGVARALMRAIYESHEPPWVRQLTPRPLDVLPLVAEGRSNKEISTALGIDEDTVDKHVRKILEISGLPSRTRVCASLRGLFAWPARTTGE